MSRRKGKLRKRVNAVMRERLSPHVPSDITEWRDEGYQQRVDEIFERILRECPEEADSDASFMLAAIGATLSKP